MFFFSFLQNSTNERLKRMEKAFFSKKSSNHEQLIQFVFFHSWVDIYCFWPTRYPKLTKILSFSFERFNLSYLINSSSWHFFLSLDWLIDRLTTQDVLLYSMYPNCRFLGFHSTYSFLNSLKKLKDVLIMSD